MKIAAVAWGSLVWEPGRLRLETAWSEGGPRLPLEFARLSGGYRVTLVIVPGLPLQETYWALSSFTDLNRALKNLREAERTFPEQIHYLTRQGEAAKEAPQEVLQTMQAWLEGQAGVEAVMWTGLGSNWEARRGVPLSPQDVVDYLQGLQASGLAASAEEYFRRVPASIRTPVRKLVEERLGWLPTGAPPALNRTPTSQEASREGKGFMKA